MYKIRRLFVNVDVKIVLLEIKQLYEHFKKFKLVVGNYEISVSVQKITS